MVNQKRTKENILAASLELIHRQGFHATGLKELLAHSQSSSGSFYNYFPSKDALALALIDFQWQLIQKNILEPILEQYHDPIASLFAMLDRLEAKHLSEADCVGCFLGNLIVDLAQYNPALREQLQTVFDRWQAVITDFLVAGQAQLRPEINPELLAEQILSMIEGVLLLGRLYNNPQRLQRGFQAVRKMLNDALRQPGCLLSPLASQVLVVDPQTPDVVPIQAAAAILQRGGLVAFPTETVYGLGASALDDMAVDRIFQAKGRPATNPVIVHIADIADLPKVARHIPDTAFRLAEKFWPGPLTLVLPRHLHLSPRVTAGADTVAVRLPNHPIALALIRAAGPIAAPSANLSNRPSPTTAAHVLEDLGERIDLVLDGGETSIGLESTIVDLTGAVPQLLRPGGVSVEDLWPLLPNLAIRNHYLNATQAPLPAPGQLQKHYAPNAEVWLFQGEQAIANMQAKAIKAHQAGLRAGVLVQAEDQSHFAHLPVEILVLGSQDDLATAARRLFALLRECDRRKLDQVFVSPMPPTGLGLALWDRLLRAAAGRVI